MVLLCLFDEIPTRLADFGYIPECKSKIPRGLNEISLPFARMDYPERETDRERERDSLRYFFERRREHAHHKSLTMGTDSHTRSLGQSTLILGTDLSGLSSRREKVCHAYKHNRSEQLQR